MAHPMELREEGQNRKEFMVYIEKVIRLLWTRALMELNAGILQPVILRPSGSGILQE